MQTIILTKNTATVRLFPMQRPEIDGQTFYNDIGTMITSLGLQQPYIGCMKMNPVRQSLGMTVRHAPEYFVSFADSKSAELFFRGVNIQAEFGYRAGIPE